MGSHRSVVGLLGLGAAAVGAGSVLAVLAGAVGWGLTARSVLAVAVLGLAHGGFAGLAAPRAGVAVRAVLAVVTGLATAGVAVWLSGVAEWFALRWVVAAVPVLAWLHPAARQVWRVSLVDVDRRGWVHRHGPAAWGLAIAWVFAARALAGYFAPVVGDARWREFYVDIPWHIALTAEALDRAPTVYPWIPDVPIGYSWLFFGTLGFLGNLAGGSAAQLLVLVGPACLALVVPLALAGCTWTVSRSGTATLLAPVLFSFTRSPVLGDVETLQLTPQWVLINRDATNAMLLSIVVLLVLGLRRARRGDDRPGAPVWVNLAALFLVTFAVAGTRGGAVVPALGAAGLTWLVAVLRRREERRHERRHATWALVLVVVAIGAATLGVTRSSGSFRIDPLSFLGERGIGGPGLPLATYLSLALMLAMVGAVLLVAHWLPEARSALPPVAGASLAGVAALGLFGHPASSQLYFFHAAWPTIVVGLAVALALAVRLAGPAVWLVAVVAVVAAQLALEPPAFLPPLSWAVRGAAAAGGLLVVCGGVIAVLVRRHGPRSTALVSVAAVLVALQPWSLPEVRYPAASPVPRQTEGSVSTTQLRLLDLLRERSGPDDLVATNKHCRRGSYADGSCDARWWTVSAFAERRVLVEGWSYDYTWTSSGTDNFEPYWDPALLRANDGLFAEPDAATCRVLVAEGVDWLYADKRGSWDPRIAGFADLVGEVEDAALYRLRPDCA